jgi:hypothetical protein
VGFLLSSSFPFQKGVAREYFERVEKMMWEGLLGLLICRH